MASPSAVRTTGTITRPSFPAEVPPRYYPPLPAKQLPCADPPLSAPILNDLGWCLRHPSGVSSTGDIRGHVAAIQNSFFIDLGIHQAYENNGESGYIQDE